MWEHNKSRTSVITANHASAKLNIPHATARLTERPRLIDRLNRETRNKAVFLTAPAGFGKSALLEQWARQRRLRPAWYSLDRSDNDQARFWLCMIAAIDRVRPGFGERMADAAEQIRTSQFESAIDVLLKGLGGLRGQLVIVLDDFHTVTHTALLKSFAYFIAALPTSVHLVAAARTKPLFVFEQLTSRRRFVQLGANQLRFTLRESVEFFRYCMNVELTEADVAERLLWTEGSIAAMKLSALSPRGVSGLTISEISRPSRVQPAEMLLEEVWMEQSESVRRLLMDCSVLQQISAPLCKAVAGLDLNRDMLEQLGIARLFMRSLDERKEWYRLHELVSEFLYRRLQRQEPERFLELKEKAGLWCEGEGQWEEAVDYYVSGRRYDRAIRLLEDMRVNRIPVSPVWLRAQCSMIPDIMLAKHSLLYFSCIDAALTVDANDARAEGMMRFAEQQFLRDWTKADRNNFRGSYYFLKMVHAASGQRNQQQYARLSKPYPRLGSPLILARIPVSGLPSMIKEYECRGEDMLIDQSALAELYGRMADRMEERGLGGLFQTCLAEYCWECNDLDGAERYAVGALQAGAALSVSRLREVALSARLVLFRVLKARGLREEAARAIRKTRQELVELGMAGSLIFCDAELALMELEEGDTSLAEGWLEQYGLTDGDQLDDSQVHEYHCLARIYAALGRSEAVKLTERLLDIADRSGRIRLWIELVILHVTLQYRSSRKKEALAGLQAVLLESDSRKTIRAFIDGGQPIGELLALHVRDLLDVQADYNYNR